MFTISQGKGFTITFENGWTVSVQFGEGNYCSNRFIPMVDRGEGYMCANAEIAAWPNTPEGSKPCENWYSFGEYKDEETGEVWGHEHVKGWCKPDAVLAFMNEIANKPKE